jgi:hypothetical protein
MGRMSADLILLDSKGPLRVGFFASVNLIYACFERYCGNGGKP